jgi:hypothetical protein
MVAALRRAMKVDLPDPCGALCDPDRRVDALEEKPSGIGAEGKSGQGGVSCLEGRPFSVLEEEAVPPLTPPGRDEASPGGQGRGSRLGPGRVDDEAFGMGIDEVQYLLVGRKEGVGEVDGKRQPAFAGLLENPGQLLPEKAPVFALEGEEEELDARDPAEAGGDPDVVEPASGDQPGRDA